MPHRHSNRRSRPYLSTRLMRSIGRCKVRSYSLHHGASLTNYIEIGFQDDSPPATPAVPGLGPALQAPAVPFSTATKTPGMFPPPGPSLRVIYQHVRKLSGVVDTLFVPPEPDDTPLPSLGPLAMSYLHAHGYDTSSVLHIYSSYQKSTCADDFANMLSSKGLPFTEGRYIWEIIYNGRPELTFN
jgi:hypothetical protein